VGYQCPLPVGVQKNKTVNVQALSPVHAIDVKVIEASAQTLFRV